MGGPRIARFGRREFLEDYWPGLYAPGEHVGFIEPTGQGKTHLAYQLAEVALEENPQLSFLTLMPKPKDPATRRWADRLDLDIIASWPPPPRLPFQRRARGHVLWPRHLKNAPTDQNRAHLAAEFRKALTARYWQGNSIVLADDLYILAVILGLNMDLEEWWTSGQAMPAGLWSPNQKPTGSAAGYVSTFSYNAPAHLFLGHDPDTRNQRRFGEIGGVDPMLVAEIVRNLPVHRVNTPAGPKNISEKLYISKRGYMCTVGL